MNLNVHFKIFKNIYSHSVDKCLMLNGSNFEFSFRFSSASFGQSKNFPEDIFL